MAENSNATIVEPSETLTTDEVLVAADAGTKRKPTKTPSKVWVHFTKNEGDKDKYDGDFRFAMLQKFKKMRETKDCIDTKNEVDRYMLVPSEDPYNENFYILLWWKLNATKYQVLSQIDRDVFAIPVSRVAFESAFSIGGRILDSFRSSLGAKMVEALICTQNWLRSTSRSIKFESIVEEMKILEVVESGLQYIDCDDFQQALGRVGNFSN
ncbi:hypothetical protein LWI28_006589 [Acer negundo]|uniref:HAT C-terminal dimerisation domain-containing protein n=1 Tax=Acer negundo TaxID=4023 RepID=A0AAD5P3U2_ACENE|nr:hypothetical protein LWI28_006589 [Acer negundo]